MTVATQGIAQHRAAWRAAAGRLGSVVVVATADWDAPHWTNKQHVASRLAECTDVLYVESLGMREPRPTAADLARVARRLRRRGGPGGEVDARPRSLSIASPVVVPLHRFAAVRRLNRRLLDRQLRPQIVRMPRPRVLWTYAPVVVDELDLGLFDAVVYHCVDDYGAHPGMPGVIAAELEPRVARAADVVFATSPVLADRMARINESTTCVGNVADYEHFAAARRDGPVPADLEGIPRPRLLFVGALSDHKVDLDLVGAVAERRPDWSFVLIGRRGDEKRMRAADELARHANCHLLGHRDYAALPSYLRGADVALIPYRRSRHTDAVFPMKAFEYLAAGLPVVSTDLPALRGLPDWALARVSGAAAFVRAVEAALARERDTDALATLAAGRTWDSLLAGMLSELERRLQR